MADEIVAPGVEQMPFALHGGLAYVGDFESLAAAGLLPDGCISPSANGGRCIRWTDADGRHWRLGKWSPAPKLKLYRVSTRMEREAADKMGGEFARAIEIDRALRNWGDDRREIERALWQSILQFREQVRGLAWPCSPHRGPWTVAKADRDQLEKLLAGLCGIVKALDLEFDPQWRPNTERELALLRDGPVVDTAAAMEARAAIGRARSRGRAPQ